MRVWKNKVFRRIMLPLLAVCFLVLLDTGIGELLRPVSYANCFNHDIAAIEQSGQEADLLFVGASRVYRTFVPEVFEESMGLACAVNAGSSSQPICATYYALKDLIERIHPKQVLIGVTWNLLDHTSSLQGRLIVYDRLQLHNKLEMAVNCFDLSEQSYLSAVVRFKDNFTLKKMRKNAEEKAELAGEDDYKLKHRNEYYADTGFVYSYNTYADGNVPVDGGGSFSADRLKPENVAYLDACIDLCKQNGIEVALVSGATTMMRLYRIRNYQKAVDYFTEYAKERGIAYYNTNYLRGREEFLPDSRMHDANHTNGEGARAVSEKLAEVLKKAAAGEDVSPYFYENLDALKRDVHRIVAVDAEITADTETKGRYLADFSTLRNEGVTAAYRLLARRDGEEEFTVIRDWQENPRMAFTLESGSKYIVRIEAGSADGTYGTAFQEYSVKGKKIKRQTVSEGDEE